MLSIMYLATSLTLTTLVQAGPVQLNYTKGRLPIVINCVEELGDVHSETTYVKRDLGFQGQIGNNIVITYGDTMFSDTAYSDTFRGMTSDSMALATHNPLNVIDLDLDAQGFPKQFCPIMSEYNETSSECAMGITNVVETYSGQGVLYFLKNHRPHNVNRLVGAGVATVSLSEAYPPVPHVQRLCEFWWDGDIEPWYGDVGAIRSGDYIYAYGHAKSTPYVYLTRVKWQDATELSCYQYWNGDSWQTERLQNFGEKEGVFWQINQGQVIWSNYYNSFLFVYCGTSTSQAAEYAIVAHKAGLSDNWMNNKILAKTSAAPEGPWSDAITLYQATPITSGSCIYAAVPHPYYDQTGKTLVITFTNHPNVIQAIRITFD